MDIVKGLMGMFAGTLVAVWGQRKLTEGSEQLLAKYNTPRDEVAAVESNKGTAAKDE